MPRRPDTAPGQTFGTLTVLGGAKSDRHGNIRWACSCACGNPRVLVGELDLRRNGGRRSCGECAKFIREAARALRRSLAADKAQACQMSQPIPPKRGRPSRDYAGELAEIDRFNPQPGQRFGDLTFLGHLRPTMAGVRRADCSCACGRPHFALPTIDLIRWKTQDCGCALARRKGKPAPYTLEQDPADLRRDRRKLEFIRKARALGDTVWPGETYGCLLILAPAAPRERDGMPRFLCDCNCGNKNVLITAGTLVRRTHLSCGCTRVRKSKDAIWKPPPNPRTPAFAT